MRPDVFEVGVAHVVDAEDVDVGVLGDAFLDVGVELEGEFFALLSGLGHVHHFGALGFGHRKRVVIELVVLKEVVQILYNFVSNFLIGLSGRQDFMEFN